MKNFVLCIFLFISLVATAQKKKPLYTAPIGVQAYSFRNSFPIDPAKTMDTIKAMGITEIEGIGNGLTAEQFKKLCDERGITIPSFGVGYDKLVNDTQGVVKDAKVLGAKFVMTAWIPHEADFNLENARKAVEDFNTAGKILKENGITFCYHIHGYEFYPHENGTLLDYIIQKTNPEYVSFEMDIMWTHFGGGDPVKLLNQYGGRWKLMHLKDLRKGTKKDLSGGTSVENDVVLGTGELNIPEILKAAKKVGIKHYFIEDESSSVTIQIPQSIFYMKGLKE